MKISVQCTQIEKEIVLEALASGDVCMYEKGDKCFGGLHCKECLEKKIQWEITDK